MSSELDEQAGAGDARDAALEARADAVGEMVRDQPVIGFALGLHGAALGRRNLRGNLRQRRDILAGGQAVGAEVLGADEPTMHDQVGIAANGRGEVGVAAEIQSEVPVVLRRVFSLDCERSTTSLTSFSTSSPLIAPGCG